MARANGRLNWEAIRPDLAGVSLNEWLTEHRPQHTANQMADLLTELTGARFKVTTVATAVQRLGKPLSDAERRNVAAQRGVPAVPRWDSPPRVNGDALVLSDMQVPYQDERFVTQCVRLARHWKVKTCILAGDWADMQSLNAFGQPALMPLSDELAAVRELLRKLHTSFDKILMLMGNHEARVGKSSQGHMSVRDLLQDFLEYQNIELSDYYHCEVGDNWIVTHPINASAIAGRTPYFLAAKFGRHVISTHNHISGQMKDISGRYRVIDAGMCADPAKLQYAMVRHSTRPAMNQGSVILRHGYAWPLDPLLSDWQLLWKLGR